MPELHLMDYKWPRPGCPYMMPTSLPDYAPNKSVLGEPDITDIATGSQGMVLRSFGRQTQVGFIPGSGISDQEEVYHLEVEVIKPAKGKHHKEGDRVIWMRPVKMCTAAQQKAFEL